jgi:hypothetical protein
MYVGAQSPFRNLNKLHEGMTPERPAMGKFAKILQDDAQVKAQKLAADSQKASAEAAREDEFRKSVSSLMSTTVLAAFEEFVADLAGDGYAAEISRSVDGAGNPDIAVRFALKKGQQLAIDPSEECALRVRGDAKAGTLEVSSQFDMRAGRKASGDTKKSVRLEDVSRASIDADLVGCLNAALAARKS